ncbi:hypothetical protein COCNU_scaffold005863G000020 [Cocos nucifera]|nr:hypothetical protein [Cocos nucifera]
MLTAPEPVERNGGSIYIRPCPESIMVGALRHPCGKWSVCVYYEYEVNGGLVKILKKYDKRTGALIRQPFIQKVLQQPFFTTDLLYKLVKECEAMLDRLFPKKEQPPASGDGAQKPSKPGSSLVRGGFPELEDIEYMESLYMKSTIAALRALKEIRSGSSTVSVFSLPPLQSSGLEERWNKIPVLEQVAK